MVVDIDETGSDHAAGNIEYLRGGRSRQVTDRGDAIVDNAHIGAKPGGARAVNHIAAAEDQIEQDETFG